MGRTPCCMRVGLNRGPWTPEEDLRLSNYVETHGEGGWRTLPKKAGLLRCGKSCRLRWMNYLRPDVKRGRILPEEEDLILRLHRLLGNRWSLIAGRMPGRTDNEIKNYWNTHLSKKLISEGIDPRTHKPLSESHDIYQSSGDSDIAPKSSHHDLAQSSPLIPEKVADLEPSNEGSAGPEKENGVAQCPHNNNVNHIPVSSDIPSATALNVSECHVNYISEPFHHALLKSGAMGTPYVFQENFLVDSNNHISIAPLMATSSVVETVGHENQNNYLMNNSFTRSCGFRLPSSQGAPSSGQIASSHPSLSGDVCFEKQQVSEGLQAFGMEFQNSGMVPPSMTACNKLTNTNIGGPAFSFPSPITTASMGTAFGDCSSDMFSSLLESLFNEELQSTVQFSSVSESIQPCQNQPQPDNISYDLWSLLSPTAPYHPST